MALITCWKCEKRYSDTVDKCIHCGASKERPDGIEEASATPERLGDLCAEAPRVDNPKYKDFFSYSDEERDSLEKDFWKYDNKAFKWRRIELEVNESFKNLRTLLIPTNICFFAMMVLGRTIDSDNISNFILAFMVGVIIALAWSMVLGIGLGVTKIYVNSSIKSLIYLKKLQKWLLEEKRIIFIPRFSTRRKKEAFDSLDLKYTEF